MGNIIRIPMILEITAPHDEYDEDFTWLADLYMISPEMVEQHMLALLKHQGTKAIINKVFSELGNMGDSMDTIEAETLTELIGYLQQWFHQT